MKRVAITGASGFVGGHLVRAAVAAGLEPVGYVRSERAAALVRDAGGAPVDFAEEPAALARSFEGALAVVHLAQIGSERGGHTYEAVNVGLTARVVEAARRAEVPRFVMFSGLGVARYGQSRRVTDPLLPVEAHGRDGGLRLGAGRGGLPAFVCRRARGRVRAVGPARHAGGERSSGRATAPTACSRSRSPTPPRPCWPRSRVRRTRSRRLRPRWTGADRVRPPARAARSGRAARGASAAPARARGPGGRRRSGSRGAIRATRGWGRTSSTACSATRSPITPARGAPRAAARSARRGARGAVRASSEGA
jgi:hypothetical protein